MPALACLTAFSSFGGEAASNSTWPMLAALGAAFTWAVGTLFFNRALRSGSSRHATSPAAANLFKNTVATAVFALAAWALHSRWPAAGAWPALLASGALGFALGDGLYFAALPHLGTQRTAMLVQLNVPVSAISSALFYGERFPPALLAAMSVVVGGILLVVRADRASAEGAASADGALTATEDARGVARSRRVGILCALGAVLFQSAGTLVGHGMMQDVDVTSGMVVRILGGVLASFVVVPLGALAAGVPSGRELRRLVAPLVAPSHARTLVAATIFGALLGLPLFHFALRELDSGLGMVLFSTTPLFTLPLTSLFGERHGARAWWGTALGFAGVVGVVWIQHARA